MDELASCVWTCTKKPEGIKALLNGDARGFGHIDGVDAVAADLVGNALLDAILVVGSQTGRILLDPSTHDTALAN